MICNTPPGSWTHPLYRTWTGMMHRCHNPRSVGFKRYGATGVEVCERWRTFDHFSHDVGERPPGMTLDRLNNDLGYYPENCRWATRKQQSQNRRNVTWLTILDETKTLKEWARDPVCAVVERAIKLRIDRGWDHAFAVMLPGHY